MITKTKRNLILLTVVIIIVATITYIEMKKSDRFAGNIVSVVKNLIAEKDEWYDPAKELAGIQGHINTDESFNLKDLVGKKVVLIDFWTYSCINCQRTTPYLNGWYEKYKDQGLEIIGVHTPEFAFEKKIENVRKAVENFQIKYPVVLDNDFATWHAYKNRYWPRKYLVDIDGYIVYDHIGEGAYEKTEKKIQELLQERKNKLELDSSISIGTIKVENPDQPEAESPEIYFGAWRNTGLGNGKTKVIGQQELSLPKGIKKNILYLEGNWFFAKEFATNQSGGEQIVFRYKAKNVFMVASTAKNVTNEVRMKIYIDGVLIVKNSGEDVEDGIVTVTEERLYKLIKSAEVEEHTLEIEILDPGLEAFTFTFG